jgi:hypothetical protein
VGRREFDLVGARPEEGAGGFADAVEIRLVSPLSRSST